MTDAFSQSSESSSTGTTIGSFTDSALSDLTGAFIDDFVKPSDISTSILEYIQESYSVFEMLFNKFVDSTTAKVGTNVPVTQSQTFDAQKSNAINMLAGAKPGRINSIPYITRLMVRGYIYPLVKYDQARTSPIILFDESNPLTTSLSSKCSGDDWSYRFSTEEFQALCGTDSSPTGTDSAKLVLNAMEDYPDEFKLLMALRYYAPLVANCSTSISKMPTTEPSTSTTGSASSSTNVPLVQCYYSPKSTSTKPTNSNSWNYELINLEDSTIDSLSNNTSEDETIKTAFTTLKNQLDTLADSVNSSNLYQIPYTPTYDLNGAVAGAYGPLISTLQSYNTTAIDKVEGQLIKLIVNDVLERADSQILPIDAVTPSVDSVIYPSHYGTQECNPEVEDGPDTSFIFDTSIVNDYAKSYIENLMLTVGMQTNRSQFVSLEPLKTNDTTSTSIYIHGGAPVFCDNSFTSDDAYKALCADESTGTANVYVTNLVPQRSGISTTISTQQESSGTLMNGLLAGTSASFSNLVNMYNRRALIGNKTKCTMEQLDAYYANWRFSQQKTFVGEDGTETQETWVKHVSTLEDSTTLMREAVLLLSEINRTLQNQQQTMERQLALLSLTSIYTTSPNFTSGLAKNATTTNTMIDQFNTAYQDTSSSSSGSSSSTSDASSSTSAISGYSPN
ncbi:MAG: hypothetical protein CMF41_06860 [Legionellales bacterium]|nr:hypothetical protein [Legionellales bacterium]OUX63765.1 MAG: hypothetical protein CBE41_04515 [Gammaproteobacteria bacterium TMED281]